MKIIKTFIFLLLVVNIEVSGLKPIVLENNNYTIPIRLSVNRSVEYIILFHTQEYHKPLRVSVSSNDTKENAPIMTVVRQEKDVISWQVPFSVDDSDGNLYNITARTLCQDNYQNSTLTKIYNELHYYQITSVRLRESPIISISTQSKHNVTAEIIVTEQVDFYIKPNKTYDFTVTPSEPKYFFYDFTEKSTKNSNFKTVVLEVNSPNETCMVVSIQNATCPIFDLNHDITYQGYFETVATKGGITISKEKFPNGFFIVFVVKGNDEDCTGVSSSGGDRRKSVNFIVKPSITMEDYINAMLVVFFGMILLIILFTITYLMCLKSTYRPRTIEYVEENTDCSPSVIIDPDFLANISMDETEYDTIVEGTCDRELVLDKPIVYLSDLARKDPRILKRKSNTYLWHVLTVALFYGLPTIQLVITYQKVLNDTGNQDLCYYNFLCANPLGFFSDFNHIFSNIGYVLFGIVFLWIVVRREKWHKDIDFDKNYGIPQHYGLFYALGVALIMEGILSASYHICPNHNNFQFDTSFMYVIAVLCIVKLYQTRHPDVNATAYTTFGVLSIAIVLGMIGILDANLYFWIGFTLLHCLTCLYLSLQIYYMGYWKFSLINPFRTCIQNARSNFLNTFKPTRKGRLFILLIFNAVNIALIVFSFRYKLENFPIYLLGVFMINTVLYFIIYIIMKLIHKEKVNFLTTTFLIISLTCAAASMHFFLKKGISWELYPAQSRTYNHECALYFYDFHDIWHFLSAIGMFFMFMVLLTLDDDLAHTPRSTIHVF